MSLLGTQRFLNYPAQPALEEPADPAQTETTDFLSIAEHQIGGDSGGVEAAQHLAVANEVDLYEVGAARELIGEGLDDRQLPDAFSSPVREEVDEDDALGLGHAGEGIVGGDALKVGDRVRREHERR